MKGLCRGVIYTAFLLDALQEEKKTRPQRERGLLVTWCSVNKDKLSVRIRTKVHHGGVLHQVGAEEHAKIWSVDFPPMESDLNGSVVLKLMTG